MKRPLLDESDLSIRLETLNRETGIPWEGTPDSIGKTFVFRNFIEAFGFMTQAAIVAEKMNHHPDWSNAYKTVIVQLSTHESGGVTELDIELAGQMERIAAALAGNA
ncbi:MAG: 4a-hydroxytetrahydrobiopterin dehydratase [Gammaproteobacteria bacterium]|nr:4a-hydroxytetrahydrobiopterin dehydratase [Gammaproteobacteria bacterium]